MRLLNLVCLLCLLVAPASAQVYGTFSCGDGLGDNQTLWLRKDSTFHFEREGDIAGAGPYEEIDGRFLHCADHVILLPNTPNIRDTLQGIPTHLLAVRWGRRLYLVPADDMIGFCNNINQGFEPRKWTIGDFFLRDTSWNIPVDGFPQLPEGWDAYLLKRELYGKIIRRVAGGVGVANLGRRDGVHRHMTLVLQMDEAEYGSLGTEVCTVTEAYEDSCIVTSEWSRAAWVGRVVTSRFRPKGK